MSAFGNLIWEEFSKLISSHLNQIIRKSGFQLIKSVFPWITQGILPTITKIQADLVCLMLSIYRSGSGAAATSKM